MIKVFRSYADYSEPVDPYLWVVHFDKEWTDKQLKDLELTQMGATRRGGSLTELLLSAKDGKVVVEGKTSTLSIFPGLDGFQFYDLITGNY